MPTLTWVSRDEDLQRAAAAAYRLLEAMPELGYELVADYDEVNDASRLG